MVRDAHCISCAVVALLSEGIGRLYFFKVAEEGCRVSVWSNQDDAEDVDFWIEWSDAESAKEGHEEQERPKEYVWNASRMAPLFPYGDVAHVNPGAALTNR